MRKSETPPIIWEFHYKIALNGILWWVVVGFVVGLQKINKSKNNRNCVKYRFLCGGCGGCGGFLRKFRYVFHIEIKYIYYTINSTCKIIKNTAQTHHTHHTHHMNMKKTRQHLQIQLFMKIANPPQTHHKPTISRCIMKNSLKELEKQAFQGHIVDKGVTDSTLCYLTQIFHISWGYHNGQLTKGEFRQQREQLLRKYCARRKREAETEEIRQQCTAVFKEYQENIRLAQQCLLDIERTTDTKQIALLACKALGAMTGEASFYGRQEKKIESCTKGG